jgi:hypothetical protein
MEVDESGAKVFIQHVHNNVSFTSPTLLSKFRKLDGQECMNCSELIQRKDISKIARKSAEWCECSSLVLSKQENGVNITMIFELKRWRVTTTWKKRSPLLEQLSRPLSPFVSLPPLNSQIIYQP